MRLGDLGKAAALCATIGGGVAAGILLLIAFNLLLGLSGIDLGSEPTDPFAGFSSTQSRFVMDNLLDGTTVYRTRPSRRRRQPRLLAEQPRYFRAEKKSGGFRIFIVGGSSAAGVPYGAAYGFGEWLERRLNATAPNVEWEVINAAFSGYATRRIVTIMDEIAGYGPDLVIVYSGHNEFAEQRYYQHLLDRDPRLFRLMEVIAGTNIYRWWSSTISDQAPAVPTFEIDDQNRSFEMFAVMAERAGGGAYPSARERAFGEILYERNLRSIARRAREAGAELMLLTLSQNFSDWEPGASAHGEALDPGPQKRWAEHFAAGERAATQDCNAALNQYFAALALDDGHALLHYRIATCLRGIGDHPRAKVHYELASNLDRVPQGAPLELNRIIRDVADDEAAHQVDVESLLELASGNGLVGDNFFTDFVHPNIDAHQRIAKAIADEIRKRELAPAARWVEVRYSEPSSQRLLDQLPQLRVDEHLARGLACVLSLRRDCVRQAAQAALAIDPDNEVALEYLSMLEQSSIWDLGDHEPVDRRAH